MEMNGGSTASYLARAPCVAVFLLVLIGLEAKGLLDFQGLRGITSVVRWNLRPVILGQSSLPSTNVPKSDLGWGGFRNPKDPSVLKILRR